MDKKPNPATTPADVTAAELAIGDVVGRAIAPVTNPWLKRLDPPDRDDCLKRLVRRLGFRYAGASLENFMVDDSRQKAAVEQLRRFSADMPERIKDGSGLMLIGCAGTGKDHLLAAVLKLAVVVHRFSVDWWDGGALFDAIHAATKDETAGTWASLRGSLLAPQILAISDPVPPRGELTVSQLRRLRDSLDRRYRERKSTWLTTNVDTQADAEGLLTEPLVERLTENSLQIRCDWPSYRKPPPEPER